MLKICQKIPVPPRSPSPSWNERLKQLQQQLGDFKSFTKSVWNNPYENLEWHEQNQQRQRPGLNQQQMLPKDWAKHMMPGKPTWLHKLIYPLLFRQMMQNHK